MKKAIVFNIQRFSIHDGPGIRSVVFFKGCPLACKWCSNPESQDVKPEVFFIKQYCIGCGACAAVCNSGAIVKNGNSLAFDKEKCTQCGKCAAACPAGTRVITGKPMAAEEIVSEILKDLQFYRRSGGGVTFSGGEPACQGEFLNNLALALKEKYIHTAVETTGCLPWKDFYSAVKNIDLILFDLKGFDETKHIKNTGISNRTILSNAAKIYQLIPTIYRLPVIPGFNDDIQEIKGLASYIAQNMPNAEVNLMPYHALGTAKYERLNRDYPAHEVKVPSKEDLNNLLDIFMNYKIHASIV